MVDNPYTTEQQLHILEIAREVVTATLSYQNLLQPEPTTLPEYLQQPRGCFVTLHNRDHQLRGCIGTFDATRPLIEALHQMGAAVTKDPRFIFSNPVTLAELNDLLVEVSVLTPLEKMHAATDLVLGKDGIYIKTKKDGRPISGCFLPQVPIDQNWDVLMTLSHCCAHKMGLEPDAWKTDPDMEFFRFHSIIIEEEKPGVLREAEV